MPDTLRLPAGHVRLGSNSGQPMTRRDGLLKVTGAAHLCRRQPPGRACCTPSCAVSTIARGRVASLDVAAAKAHPGVVEVITPANRPPLAQDPDAKHGHVRLPHRGAAERPRALCQASRSRSSSPRRWRPRPRARACSRRPTRPSPRGSASTAASASSREAVGIGSPAELREGRPRRRPAAAAHRIETEIRDADPVPQRHGAACHRRRMGRRPADASTRRTRRSRWRRRPSPPFSASRPRTSHLRSPFLGGGFGSKAILAGPLHPRASWPRACSGGRSSWCCRATRCSGPSGIAAPRGSACASAWTRDGRLTALEHHAVATTSSFDDFLEPAANASHNLYASPAISTRHTRRAGRYRHARARCGRPARPPARPRSNARWTRRPRPAGSIRSSSACATTPRPTRPSGKPVLVQGAARVLRRRRAERFGWAGPAARAAADARRRRPARRLGHGHARSSRRRCSSAEARAMLRADGTALVETSAADMGQGAWTALAQIAADGLGLDIDQVEFRAGHSDHPDGGVAGGSGHTATAGSALFNAGARRDRQARRACHRPTRTRRSSAPATPASRRATAGCTTAATRAAARAMPTSSPAPASTELEGRGRGARDPANARGAGDVLARRGLRRGQGRPRSRPGPGQPARRRLRGRADHQPAPGAQPALRRDDLGALLRAARGGDPRPPHRPADECRPRRLPRPGQCRRPVDRGAARPRGRPLRQRARGSRASARSASPAPSAPSPMPSGTPPASGPAASRSGSRS